MPCSTESCTLDAQWRPLLELRSAKKGEVSILRFCQLVFCDEHKSKSTLESLLSDEAFVKIAKNMRENGKKVPIQRNTTLTWEKLSPELLETLTPLTIANPNTDDDLAF
jgi:hypothetical protein